VAYAFREGSRLAVFVLSRRLAAATPVTLQLPFRPRSATLHALAADPRSTNLRRERVRVREERLRAPGPRHTFSLPPGAIYLFVFEAPEGGT
jgi:hypothetical protein